MVKLLCGVDRAVLHTKPEYYYVYREDSITTSRYKPRDMNVIEAYTENRRFVMQHYPQLKKQADFRYFWGAFLCAGQDAEYGGLCQGRKLQAGRAHPAQKLFRDSAQPLYRQRQKSRHDGADAGKLGVCADRVGIL